MIEQVVCIEVKIGCKRERGKRSAYKLHFTYYAR